MNDFRSSFKDIYGCDLPVSAVDLFDFLKFANSGGLTDILGDFELINSTAQSAGAMPIELEGMYVFMWVEHDRHIDYYCFESLDEDPSPVVIIADNTVVNRWLNFGDFLVWLKETDKVQGAR